jgi:hypothetical protein
MARWKSWSSNARTRSVVPIDLSTIVQAASESDAQPPSDLPEETEASEVPSSDVAVQPPTLDSPKTQPTVPIILPTPSKAATVTPSRIGQLWERQRYVVGAVSLIIVVLIGIATLNSRRTDDTATTGDPETVATSVASSSDDTRPSTGGSSTAWDCVSGVTADSTADVIQFCGPATASATVGKNSLQLQGGSCQRGDGWFNANVGIFSTDIANASGGLVTISAGVFPPDLDPIQRADQSSTTTTLPRAQGSATTVLVPDAANIASTTTTTMPPPVTGDGIYPGQALIVVRLGAVATSVDTPILDLSQDQRSVAFSGKSFETGQAVSGTITCA